MIGLSTVLITPKIRATMSSVSALEASLCPATTIPGTTQAATPSAAADTRIPMTCFMTVFLPDKGHAAWLGCALPRYGREQPAQVGRPRLVASDGDRAVACPAPEPAEHRVGVGGHFGSR